MTSDRRQAQAQGSPSAAGKKAPRIVLHFDGLVYTAPKGHPTTTLVRALPQRRYCGAVAHPESKYPPAAWLIALTPENIPGLRRLYAAGCSFSDESIAALKALAVNPGPAERKARPSASIQVAPEVVPSCRQLEASTGPLPGIAP